MAARPNLTSPYVSVPDVVDGARSLQRSALG
jgi:hypothetical protein